MSQRELTMQTLSTTSRDRDYLRADGHVASVADGWPHVGRLDYLLQSEEEQMKLVMHLRLAEWDRKRFKQFFFLVLLKILMPTPALGFVLGALVSAVILIVFRGLLLSMSLFGALAAGCVVATAAIVWQVIYDRYWEKAE